MKNDGFLISGDSFDMFIFKKILYMANSSVWILLFLNKPLSEIILINIIESEPKQVLCINMLHYLSLQFPCLY